jgi:uncharacterized lipoprotein YbaY
MALSHLPLQWPWQCNFLSDAGTVLQSGCQDIPSPPQEALSGVSLVAAGPGYSLAWKGPPVNKVLMWGSPESESAEVLASLRAALPKGGSLAVKVVQLSAAGSHALVLLANGTVIAGATNQMLPFALPPNDSVQGRLVKASAGDLFSLGVVAK